MERDEVLLRSAPDNSRLAPPSLKRPLRDRKGVNTGPLACARALAPRTSKKVSPANRASCVCALKGRVLTRANMGHMSMLPDDCYPPMKKPNETARKRPTPAAATPTPVSLDDTASECSAPDASSSSSVDAASDLGAPRAKRVARTSSNASMGSKSMSSFSGGEGRDASERQKQKRRRTFVSVGLGSSHPDYDSYVGD